MTNKLKPRTFWLHFNRINVQRNDPDIWTIHLSDRCIQTRRVEVKVPLETVYKGPEARQPRAFMRGKGKIKVYKNYVEIT